MVCDTAEHWSEFSGWESAGYEVLAQFSILHHMSEYAALVLKEEIKIFWRLLADS